MFLPRLLQQDKWRVRTKILVVCMLEVKDGLKQAAYVFARIDHETFSRWDDELLCLDTVCGLNSVLVAIDFKDMTLSVNIGSSNGLVADPDMHTLLDFRGHRLQ